MQLKQTGSFINKARWIAGLSAVALLAAGMIARQTLHPSASAPAKSAPARMRPIVSQDTSRIATNFANRPLSFEPNQGQTDKQVKFLSRNSHYNLFLTSNEAVFTLPVRSVGTGQGAAQTRKKFANLESEAVLRMKIRGANAGAKITADDLVSGHTNYLIGRDSSKWVRDIPQYARVNYSGVYPNIDLAFYGKQRQLEFDFIVKPGADPAAIALGIEGAKKIATETSGDLVLSSAAGDLLLHKPVAYQKQGDSLQPVDAKFVVKGTEVALAIGPYDHNRELVIDPAVGYGTYVGAGSEDTGSAIAVDSTGAVYITGQTASPGFTLKNPLSAPNNALRGASDAFVTKLSADGASLAYSTYLGGTGDDGGAAIAIDSAGNAYVGGTTTSTDFPLPASPPATTPFQVSAGGSKDGFIAVLNATGNGLVYSTYIGGLQDDFGEGIAVKGSSIYFVGQTGSSDLPVNLPSGSVLQNTFQGGVGSAPTDGFVAKLDLSNTLNNAVVYLGGTGNDAATGVAVDSTGNAYITGFTFSTDFPHPGTPFSSQCGGCTNNEDDAFATEIKADFTNYVYSTFLGGTGPDIGNQIAVDGAGNAFVTGGTNSTDFPTNGTNAAYKTTLTGTTGNAFLTVVKPGGSSLLYSTYLGGGGTDLALAIALDIATPAKAYITGQTSSSNFPTVNPTQSAIGGSGDAFVSVLNPNVPGTGSLVFSTYLGGTGDEDDELAGIAVDPSGNFYVTGDTQSSINISTPGSYKPTFTSSGGAACTGPGGVCRDAFVVKYLPNGPQFNVSVGAITPSSIARGSNGTATVTVTSTGASGTVNLACAIQGTAATPPTCSVGSPSGTLAANGNVTTTLTITTIKSGSIPVTGAALWLPIPGLALFGAGFLRNKNAKQRFVWSLLCTFALTGVLLMMGCGSGNVGGGGGGGGGGGTTTGSYSVSVTAAITGTGSQTNSAQFNVQ
jgi:beta-propeller repeat-containing protein